MQLFWNTSCIDKYKSCKDRYEEKERFDLDKSIPQKILEEIMLYLIVCGVFYLIVGNLMVNYIPVLGIALVSGTVIKYVIAYMKKNRKTDKQ